VRIRVGVVDDERFFREAITEVLGAEGIECVTGESGHDALAIVDDPAIGVLVLDIRMPGLDGIETLRRLRDLRPGLRVLVLSASTDQETVLEALRLGATDYLAKPLHDEELVLAVRRAAEGYALRAESERLRMRLARVVSVTEELSRNASRLRGGERRAYIRQAAVEAAAELLQARRTSLLLRDDGDSDPDGLGGPEQLRVVAAVGGEVPVEELSLTIVGEGVAGGVAARGEALLVTSRSSDERFAGASDSGRYACDCFVVVPLLGAPDRSAGDALGDAVRDVRGEAVGVLCATEPERGEPFAAEDLALLRLLAGRLAELLGEPREAKETPPPLLAEDAPSLGSLAQSPAVGAASDVDSELVRGICDALVNEVEPERVLRAVLEPVLRELSAVPVSLYLLDGGTGALVCEAQLDGGMRADRKTLPAASGLTGTVFQSGHLVATRSPELDPRFDAQVDTPEDGIAGPLLCVPLRLRGKVVGLCRVFPSAGATPSARTGEVLSAALSAAIRNVLLYRSLVESIEEVAEARRQARS
jgi:DNA-binding NarL/FixJ family response regulator